MNIYPQGDVCSEAIELLEAAGFWGLYITSLSINVLRFRSNTNLSE